MLNEIYDVNFYYGDYKQTVQFLDEDAANTFFEDVKNGSNKVELTKRQMVRFFQKELDTGLCIRA